MEAGWLEPVRSLLDASAAVLTTYRKDVARTRLTGLVSLEGCVFEVVKALAAGVSAPRAGSQHAVRLPNRLLEVAQEVAAGLPDPAFLR